MKDSSVIFQLPEYFESSGIRVRLVSSLEELDPDNVMSEKSRSNDVVSKFSERENAVCIYIKDEESRSDSFILKHISSSVIYETLFHRGIGGLFGGPEGDKYREYMEKVILAARLPDLAEAVRLSWKKDGSLTGGAELFNSDSAKVFSSCLEEMYNLSLPWDNTRMLASAMSVFDKNRKHMVASAGDTVSMSALCRKAIGSTKKGFNIGTVPESYVRAGFPEVPFVINMESLRKALGDDFINEDFVAAIKKPLAVVLHVHPDGTTGCIAVTSLHDKEGHFLSMLLPKPETAVADILDAKNSALYARACRRDAENIYNYLRYSAQNDEPALASARRKGEVLFLEEYFNVMGFRRFSITKALTPFENKIGTKVTPALYGHGSSSLTFLDANIRNNFKNKKNFEDFFKKYGKKMDPLRDAREKRDALFAERDSLIATIGQQERDGVLSSVQTSKAADADVRAERAPVAAETRKNPSLPSLLKTGEETTGNSESWSVPFVLPLENLSETHQKRLRNKGIEDSAALKEYGYDAVKRLVGKSNADSLFAYAERIKRHPRSMDEKEFLEADVQAKEKEVRRDAMETFKRIPADVREVEIRVPVGADGTLISGTAGFLLAAKATFMGRRWDDCPIFVTREELGRMGFEPTPTAEPTHLPDGDGYMTLYNLHETTLAADSPDLYERYFDAVDKADTPSVPNVVRYMLDTSRIGESTLLSNFISSAEIEQFGSMYEKSLLKRQGKVAPDVAEAIGSDTYKKLVTRKASSLKSARQWFDKLDEAGKENLEKKPDGQKKQQQNNTNMENKKDDYPKLTQKDALIKFLPRDADVVLPNPVSCGGAIIDTINLQSSFRKETGQFVFKGLALSGTHVNKRFIKTGDFNFAEDLVRSQPGKFVELFNRTMSLTKEEMIYRANIVDTFCNVLNNSNMTSEVLTIPLPAIPGAVGLTFNHDEHGGNVDLVFKHGFHVDTTSLSTENLEYIKEQITLRQKKNVELPEPPFRRVSESDAKREVSQKWLDKFKLDETLEQTKSKGKMHI